MDLDWTYQNNKENTVFYMMWRKFLETFANWTSPYISGSPPSNMQNKGFCCIPRTEELTLAPKAFAAWFARTWSMYFLTMSSSQMLLKGGSSVLFSPQTILLVIIVIICILVGSCISYIITCMWTWFRGHFCLKNDWLNANACMPKCMHTNCGGYSFH